MATVKIPYSTRPTMLWCSVIHRSSSHDVGGENRLLEINVRDHGPEPRSTNLQPKQNVERAFNTEQTQITA